MPDPRPPALYSNDSCPFAMRARLTLHYCQIEVEHREIRFDNKPPSMLAASPKGTVPVMVFEHGAVIDESWSIMQWALEQNDPENWVGMAGKSYDLACQLVDRNDNGFAGPAYYYQYADRDPGRSRMENRTRAEAAITPLEKRLEKSPFLGGETRSVADIAVFPFIDVFSRIEADWFATTYPHLQRWMDAIKNSDLWRQVAVDHEPWPF